MRHRRAVAYLLALLSLAVGLALLAGAVVLLKPTKAQSMPDLAIIKYVDGRETDPFAPGNEITYQIYYINQGSYVANDVRIVDTLPEHTTYVSSSQPGFVLIQGGPDQVVWVRDRLSVFERGWLSVTVRVNADVPVGAGVENTAYILCLDPESNYDNNESTVKSYIRPVEPDLRVTKHLWPNSNPIAPGNEIIYEIVAENWGGSVANSVRLTDTLPADCAYTTDNTASTGFTTVQTGTTIVWTRASLAPNPKHPGKDTTETLYVHCQIAGGWTQDQWLENVVEIATIDAEYSYDDNLSRWVYKPEADRRYSAAITSLDDKTFRQISDAGFDYALYYLDWSETEPNDDEYYWGNVDSAVWQAWRYNLRLVVRADRAPAWARGPGTETAPPTNPAKLGEFLQAVAARWPRQPGNPDKAQIYGYVIWNEPNLAAEWGGNAPDAAAYTALLQAAYNGVKAGSVNAWVISAGLAPTGDDPPNAFDDRTYLQAMYTAGAGGTFDYLGANPMGFAYAPDDTSDPNGFYFSRAEAWRAIMEANSDGAKGMFGTETGWLRNTPIDLGSRYNWTKVSDIDQAHYLARAYHKGQCEWGWMGPLTTWNLDFATGDYYTETDHAYWFGVTDENGEPLRSYRTLQNAATRGPADLWLEKELVDPLIPGQEFRYVIRYTNIGGQTASGVVMTDTLPLGAEYVSDSGGGTLNLAGDAVVWNLGEVYTCTYEAITLTLRLVGGDPDTALLNNQVKVNTMPSEPYTDDNVATAVNPLPDLLGIHKSVTPARVGPGQFLTYTLAFSNTGEITATGVVISDVVPVERIADLSYTRSGAAITPTGSISYTWQVQDLTPGEGGTITITAVISPNVSGTFSLTNRATISTTSQDLFWPNDTSVVSNTVDGDPPLPPALASPGDGAATNDNTPTLTWNPSLSADAAGYLLDFDGAVQDVGDVTQYTTGTLANGTTYTWTVAAYDNVGNTSVYTNVWSFTVDTDPPLPPVLISPTNGITLATNTPTLTWDASPSADAAGYLLDLDGTVQDAGNVTQTVTGTLVEGIHTWTVAAYDAAGNTSAYTDTWTFVVDTIPPPPVLLSPADGAAINDNTPTLTWNACPCADIAGYLLDFDGAVQDVGNTTQYTTSLLVDGTYTWTGAAYDATGYTSTFTATWSFTVDTELPLPPVLVSPVDSTITDTTNLTLTWQASPSADAAGYLLDFDGVVQDVGNTTWFTTGLLADGTYTWTVATYDAASNASAYTDTWSFTVDTIPPPLVLVSPANGVAISDTTPTLTWQASAAPDIAGYSLDLDGAVQDVGDTTQYTTSVLADGTYTWTVAAYDATGHTSAYTDTWSFTVDTLPPAPPALQSPVDGITITTDTATFSWNASPSADVAGYLLDINSVVLDVGYTTRYTIPILADGAYTWTMAAYDAAGNTGAYTDTWSLTVDTTPLPPALLSPADGVTLADDTPTLTWNPSPSPNITGYLLNLDGLVYDVGNVTYYTTNVLADGIYTWTIASYNSLAYVSAFTDTWTFGVDTTPPPPPSLSSPADGTLTNTTSLTLTWQASPSSDMAGYLLDFDGVVQDAGNTTWFTTGLLADGTYTWTVAAYDTMSNTSAYTDTWSFTVDTTPPTPPALTNPADGTLTDTSSLTLTWQASPSTDVAGYLLDFDGTVLHVGNTTQVDTGFLADGTYTWTVAVYDVLGNTSAYTATRSFTVDTTAPIPPALLSPTDALTTADNTPTLTWRASPSPDAAGYMLDFDGVVLDVGNTTRYTTTILADGTYTWTVAAYDALSHTSAYTEGWLFVVDTMPPTPPTLTSPVDDTLTDTTNLTLTWQASPSADVAGYLLDTDGTVQNVGDVIQYAAGLLADGTYTWTVAAYDVVSNTSAYTDTWAFTVDTTAPIPPALTNPVNGALTNTSSLTLTWQASPSADVAGYLLDFGGAVLDVGDFTRHHTGSLADGTYTWTVAAYDVLSHTGAFTDTWSFAVDTTPPAPPMLLSPLAGTLTNTSSLTLTWQGSPSADAAGYLLDFDGTVYDVGNITQYATGILADGTYTWTVATYDALGHTSTFTDTWPFTIDTWAPAIVAVAPADGATEVATTAPVIITFSRPIEIGTFAFVASPDPGGWSAAWNSSQTIVTLTHTPFGYWRTYDVTVTAASDPLGNSLTVAPYVWSFTTGLYRLHLPLVTKRFVLAPDLVVERIIPSSDDVQVVVKNQGNAPTTDGFWVDVYIDPDPIPTAVNQIWNHLASAGLVWGVTAGLQPGEMLTLTVGGDYYAPEYSHVTRPLAAGTPVYAQADSANANTTYGAVLENHEITDGEYNNIGGPAYPIAIRGKETAEPLAPEKSRLDPLHNLPPRQ